MTKNALVSDHVNVESSALALLEQREWILEILPNDYDDDDGFGTYCATKDGTRLYAEDPLRLLGLSQLHDHHHPHDGEPYWWCIEGREPDLKSRLENEALEKALRTYKERDLKGWTACVRAALEKRKGDLKVSVEDDLGISKTLLDELWPF